MNKLKLYKFPVIATLVLFAISFADLLYGYYTFMKFIVTGTAVYYAYFIYTELNKGGLFFWGLVVIAILFNPIVPIHLRDKSLWEIIDVIVGIFLVIMLVSLNRELKKHKLKSRKRE